MRRQVAFSLATDFENYTTFKPANPVHETMLNEMLDQLVAWSAALKTIRGTNGAGEAPVQTRETAASSRR